MTETQFPVITICGSMRYFDRMLEVASEFTGRGYIVLMPFVHVIKPEDQENNPVKEMLDEMHLSKIAMSESILVVGSYTGKSTNREIQYAIDHGKTILRTE